jgi:hypothetical protein
MVPDFDAEQATAAQLRQFDDRWACRLYDSGVSCTFLRLLAIDSYGTEIGIGPRNFKALRKPVDPCREWNIE